jgi:hypothetical protein
MDDRNSNIDLVFRNGLKDFEVLPPSEVWGNIYPLIRRKQKPFILMRVAAVAAVVVTVSFLAYRWSTELSAEIQTGALAVNEEPSIPDMNNPVQAGPVALNRDNPVALRNDEDIILTLEDLPSDIVGENIPDHVPQLAGLPESNDVSLQSDSKLMSQALITEQSYSDDNFELLTPDQPFIMAEENTGNSNRWSIAALASPTYYSRFISGNDEITQQLSSSEQPLISYSGGVAFSYRINKRFSVQSGLFYSAIGQEVEGINSFSGFRPYDVTKGDHNFEVLTSNGTIYTSNPDVFLSASGPVDRIMTSYTNDVFDPAKANLKPINSNLLQNFSYLELPVILRYKFVDRTVDFNLIGGLSYNMLVGNSVSTTGEGGKYVIGQTQGMNFITFSSSLGMGMEYSVSEKLSLNLEPTFRYYINPFNQMTISGVHPYSFGIFSGVSYKF